MEIQRLLTDNGAPRDIRIPFRKLLHKEPYGLKYALDADHPDLVLIHGTDKSDLSLKAVREANGIVFNRKDMKLVAYGMNRIEEFPRPPLVHPPCTEVQESEDGSVIKLFFHAGQWISSTNKRLDAKRCSWSSDRSFHELFRDALPERDYDSATAVLDRNNVYSFVLLHPENFIVRFQPVPELVHVATRSMLSLEEVSADVPWARKPKFIDREDRPPALQCAGRGVIFVDRSDLVDVRRVKLDDPEYQTAHNLRKNMKHMHLSYLACSPEEKRQFPEVFPAFAPYCATIDTWIGTLVDDVHRSYMDSFVRKQYLFDKSHPYFPLVIGCHKIYKAERTKVTKDVVRLVIANAQVTDLDVALQLCSQMHVCMGRNKI